MIKLIRALFASGPYYLKINRDRISIRDVATGHSIQIRTVLGLDDSKNVVSVGDPVSPDATIQLNPFQHPRVLVCDYTVAEKIFIHAFREMSGGAFFRPAVVAVIHPDLDLAGGLTPLEDRALRELAESAGARKTLVHYGAALSDDEVRKFGKREA